MGKLVKTERPYVIPTFEIKITDPKHQITKFDVLVHSASKINKYYEELREQQNPFYPHSINDSFHNNPKETFKMMLPPNEEIIITIWVEVEKLYEQKVRFSHGDMIFHPLELHQRQIEVIHHGNDSFSFEVHSI